MPYDPKNRRYLPQESLQHYAPEMLDRIKRDTILINEALGYDLNTVEFAIKDGVPYAIDFTNPAPDADIWSVTEPYFNWIIDKVANLLVDYAKNGKPTIGYHRWYRWLNHDATSEIASSAAQGLVSGVEQMAQKASNALSEVIDQITEPIKPKRTRKTSTEKDAKAEAKTAKGGKNAKNMKSGKK